MDGDTLGKLLVELPVGEIRYFSSIGSTNDEARSWVEQDCPDLSLVVADEQTAGRGRMGRQWITRAGTALAFSLILRPEMPGKVTAYFSRLVGVAALAVSDSLSGYALESQIKWPNDILVNQKKISGILVEGNWGGATLEAAILGIGVNVSSSSIPDMHHFEYPATCLETELGFQIDRFILLKQILTRIFYWLNILESPAIIEQWEQRLAFRGKPIQVIEPDQIISGELVGLDVDGALLVCDGNGTVQRILVGDLRIRPD